MLFFMLGYVGEKCVKIPWKYKSAGDMMQKKFSYASDISYEDVLEVLNKIVLL